MIAASGISSVGANGAAEVKDRACGVGRGCLKGQVK